MAAAILTELMSNAASVAVLLPIGLALAVQYGIDPRAVTIAIATSAGLTFILPVSTPAMALVMNSKYVKGYRCMAWGIAKEFWCHQYYSGGNTAMAKSWFAVIFILVHIGDMCQG